MRLFACVLAMAGSALTLALTGPASFAGTLLPSVVTLEEPSDTPRLTTLAPETMPGVVMPATPNSAQQVQILPDRAVRQFLIERSVEHAASAGQSCACPYTTRHDGSACGTKSLYTQQGARAVMCFPQDVSAAAVEDWRHGAP